MQKRTPHLRSLRNEPAQATATNSTSPGIWHPRPRGASWAPGVASPIRRRCTRSRAPNLSAATMIKSARRDVEAVNVPARSRPRARRTRPTWRQAARRSSRFRGKTRCSQISICRMPGRNVRLISVGPHLFGPDRSPWIHSRVGMLIGDDGFESALGTSVPRTVGAACLAPRSWLKEQAMNP
jgi:hypothetical protein